MLFSSSPFSTWLRLYRMLKILCTKLLNVIKYIFHQVNILFISRKYMSLASFENLPGHFLEASSLLPITLSSFLSFQTQLFYTLYLTIKFLQNLILLLVVSADCCCSWRTAFLFFNFYSELFLRGDSLRVQTQKNPSSNSPPWVGLGKNVKWILNSSLDRGNFSGRKVTKICNRKEISFKKWQSQTWAKI